MENFVITFQNVLGMLFFMIPGFVIRKTGLVREKDIPSISQVMIYTSTPFLVVNAFLKMDFAWGQVADMLLFFAVTLILQTAFFGILFLFIRKQAQDTEKRVFCSMAALGNLGYFGMPIVTAIFPDQPLAACYVTMAMMSLNTLLFTVGVYCVSGDRKQISFRAVLFNPASIGLYIVLPFYLTGFGKMLPDAVKNACQSLSGMAAPLSMIILGIRLASGSLKETFSKPGAYLAVFVKLAVLPVFAFAVLYFLPFTKIFKSVILVLCGAPSASIGLSLAEIHGGGQCLAANTLLLSTVFCVVTLPLIVFILVG